TGAWDFISTDCQLTWYGITLYGVIDAGFTYQTHGAPLDPRSPPGSAYIVQRYSQGPRWSLAPNGLSNSSIGIKGTEPDRRKHLCGLCSGRRLRSLFVETLQWTGIGCSQRRHSPEPAILVGRFQPSWPVV